MSGVLQVSTGGTIAASGTYDINATLLAPNETITGQGVVAEATLAGISAAAIYNVTDGAALVLDGLAGVSVLTTFNISNGGTVAFNSPVTASLLSVVNFTGGGGELVLPTGLAIDLNAPITGFDTGDTIAYTGAATGITSTYSQAFNQTTVTIYNGSTPISSFALAGNYGSDLASVPDGSGGILIELSCLLEGTLIATPAGDRAIETLRVGDLVLTAGGARAITWIGSTRVNLEGHPRPDWLRPVRIAAGAFGDGLPYRDVVASPDHAVFVDGVLVPIRYLINGRTIRTEPGIAAPHYFHLELERHGVVYAAGLPVETYLDTGARGAFDGAAATRLYPDQVQRSWEAEGFAPLTIAGPAVDRIRERLAGVAEALALPAAA